MKRMKNPVRVLSKVMLAMLLIQQVGCGTILYPSRRGQRSGNLDVGVAVMDGIGLFFFIIPGVIAYAVDFSTGAIYLPGGRYSGLSNEAVKVVHVNPADLKNRNAIKEIVVREGLMPADVDMQKADVFAVDRLEQIPALLTVCSQTGYKTP